MKSLLVLILTMTTLSAFASRTTNECYEEAKDYYPVFVADQQFDESSIEELGRTVRDFGLETGYELDRRKYKDHWIVFIVQGFSIGEYHEEATEYGFIMDPEGCNLVGIKYIRELL